nr:SusC/RagA family TonB-linked outer membrane protein [Allomuricauda sp.]
MKTLIFLWCSIALSFVPSDAISQNSKIRINTDGMLTVDEVFDLIMEQTDYRFVYQEGIFTGYPRVPVKKGWIRTNTLLNKSLARGNFMVVLTKDNTILVKDKKITDLELQRSVSGVVSDADGAPMPFVDVVVKGTTIGTTSDENGRYAITVPSPDNVLMFMLLGHKTFEVTVGNQFVINVTMEESVRELDEVVLTGYQKIEKSRTTGSFATVTNQTVESIQTLSIFDRLEGQVPGLVFVDGQPILRGVSTFRTNTTNDFGINPRVNSPLIVLDNHPIEAEFFETINADDIESVTFLKDAAAASIWGARAANGVIVLKSKRTSNFNRPISVNFSTSLSFESRPDITQANASTAALLELQEFQASEGMAAAIVGGGPIVPLGYDAPYRFYQNEITEAQRDAIIDPLRNNDLRKEFNELFLRAPIRKRYNLSASGSGEKNSYFFSASFNDLLSNTIGESDRRLNLNASNTFFISPKLKLTAAMNFYLQREKFNGYGPNTVRSFPQYDQVLDDNGNPIVQDRYNFDDIFINTGSGLTREDFPYDWRFNLLENRNELDNTNKETAHRVNASLEYALTDYLNIVANYQYNQSRNLGESKYSEASYFTRDLVNSFTILENGAIVNNLPEGAIYDETNVDFRSQTFNGQLNFEKTFGNHDITFLGGAEIRQLISDYSENRKYGINEKSLVARPVDYTTFFTRSSSRFGQFQIPFVQRLFSEENRFISTYFNAGYNYNKKYRLSGSYRLDDSNLFGAAPEYRNIPLWSIGGAWEITNEDFFNSSFVDRLVLRATRGTGGNIDRSTSPLTILESGMNFRYAGLRDDYAFLDTPPNPTLRWEKTTTLNLGLDFSLFDNRFYGSVEYYDRSNDDLLSLTDFNPTYGITSAFYNVASMSNKGLDVNLNAQWFRGKFNWVSTVNFSSNKNRVESVDFDNSDFNSYLSAEPRVGRPLNHIFSYNWAGLSNEGVAQVYDGQGNIINANDDYIFVPEDLVYSGETSPRIYGGFVNAITYKNFSFSSTLTYKFGHKFIKSSNSGGNAAFLNSTPNYLPKEFDEQWREPGDENSTDVPLLFLSTINQSTGYYAGGSQQVLDASHIRLTQFNLSYRMPKRALKGLFIKDVRFDLQARNLGVIVFNGEGIDPENSTYAVNYIPNVPEFTFTLNANF